MLNKLQVNFISAKRNCIMLSHYCHQQEILQVTAIPLSTFCKIPIIDTIILVYTHTRTKWLTGVVPYVQDSYIFPVRLYSVILMRLSTGELSSACAPRQIIEVTYLCRGYYSTEIIATGVTCIKCNRKKNKNNAVVYRLSVNSLRGVTSLIR